MRVYTPVERYGGYLVKREDRATDVPGVVGGKVRLAAPVAAGNPSGMIGYGGRRSNVAAGMAAAAAPYGVPVRFHTADGPETPEMARAAELGAVVVRHRPGYLTVLRARATHDAAARGWTIGIAGAASRAAVAAQCRNLQDYSFRRVVAAVGAGVTCAGIVNGLVKYGIDVPVLAIAVGAPPDLATLIRFAPEWVRRVTVVRSGVPYDTRVVASLGDLPLHPQYESKLIPFLEPGDLVWNQG